MSRFEPLDVSTILRSVGPESAKAARTANIRPGLAGLAALAEGEGSDPTTSGSALVSKISGISGAPVGEDGPAAATTVVALAEVLLAKASRIVRASSIDYPPQVDDMTARAINRMGGWVRLHQRWRTAVPEADAAEFKRLVADCAVYKDWGFYVRDELPRLRGRSSSTMARRLPWPPQVDGDRALDKTRSRTSALEEMKP